MKLHIVIEYDTPKDLDIEDVYAAHSQVFEDSPSDFLQYILSLKDSTLEYEFSANEDEDSEEDFTCKQYYYNNDNVDTNICRKYGALCSNILCKHVK